ncbi:MAG: response regulator [Hyphomicrobiales bacterium]
MSSHRVLVVEDEALVSMILEEMLADLGHTVVATAATFESGVHLASQEDFDVAILDLNIAGKESYEIADILIRRELPFVFATGYGLSSLREAYRKWPTLEKPFRAEQLHDVLTRLFASA